MKLLHLSDTHNRHEQLMALPPADVIIHSGDCSMNGSEEEIVAFLEWFIALDYRYKIYIAGNHDNALWGETLEGLPPNCYYLCGSGIEIEGVKFWGVPLFFEDVIIGKDIELITQIPMDVDVLITHQPPKGIMSTSNQTDYGSPELLTKVQSIKPRYHLFGHVHNGYGIATHGDTTFVNSALVNEEYVLEYTAKHCKM